MESSHMITQHAVSPIFHNLHLCGTFMAECTDIYSWLLIKFIVDTEDQLLCSTLMGFGKCIMSCSHQYSITQKGFTTLKIPCMPHICSLSGDHSFYCFYKFSFPITPYSWIHITLSFLDQHYLSRAESPIPILGIRAPLKQKVKNIKEFLLYCIND